MKIYVVTRPGGSERDCLFSVVVRAADEAHARRLALEESRGNDGNDDLWLVDASCKEVLPDGEPEVICTDFYEM